MGLETKRRLSVEITKEQLEGGKNDFAIVCIKRKMPSHCDGIQEKELILLLPG